MKLLKFKNAMYIANNKDWFDKLSITQWLDMLNIIQSNTTKFDDTDYLKNEMVDEYLNGTLADYLSKEGYV